MTNLLDTAMRAAGGLDRFNRFHSVSADLHHTGVIWALKQREGVLTDSRVTVQLHTQQVSHAPFKPTTHRSIYTPARVEIRSESDALVEVLDDPRSPEERNPKPRPRAPSPANSEKTKPS